MYRNADVSRVFAEEMDSEDGLALAEERPTDRSLLAVRMSSKY